MAEVLITEFMDAAAVESLAADFEVDYRPDLVDRPEALLAALPTCRGLIVRNRTQVRGDLLDTGGRLKVVGRLGVGLDNIDLEACTARGILVRPAIGSNAVAVAEYVIAGILMLRRGAYLSTAAVRDGSWPRARLMGREIAGAVLGLVGFGAIAREIAPRAAALGMTVIAHDPHVAVTDPAWKTLGVVPHGLDAVLVAADAVSLHVPLTDATRHLIDANALARMKSEAVLINAARGGVVDETALARALMDGGIGGAMLDVFEREPLPAGAGLNDAPNLILTPHIAGLTAESNARAGRMTAEAVRAVLESAG